MYKSDAALLMRRRAQDRENCWKGGLKNVAGDAVIPERKAAMPEPTFPAMATQVGMTT
ncbi:hypothetical protein V4C53_45655 [Paraburkholderia azotifigens]|uniref:hypothetical protein n=1 Tax=Paraburkholderia azotifigens TaxID=2057004 RepID=UPI00317F4306